MIKAKANHNGNLSSNNICLLSEKEIRFVDLAMTYMTKCDFVKSFTINSLAKKVGTNETTLKQAFKKSYGITIFKFIQQAQMQRAIDMLRTGERIKNIAKRLGYSTIGHFSHAFKIINGYPPSRFIFYEQAGVVGKKSHPEMQEA